MHRARFYLCASAICVLTACLFICLKIEYVCSSAAAVILIYAGGAPCNVLAMLNNLGRKTAFIGKVGDDAFGHMLADTVSQSGTDTSGLVFDPFVHTTLAFVHTMPGGDRSFSFYRNPGADMMLRKDEISGECIRSSSIFHFGTLSSTHPGVREATRHALQIARDSDALLSFDPNLRESLWDSLVDVRREIEYGLTQCDILRRDLSRVFSVSVTECYRKYPQSGHAFQTWPLCFLNAFQMLIMVHYAYLLTGRKVFLPPKGIGSPSYKGRIFPII